MGRQPRADKHGRDAGPSRTHAPRSTRLADRARRAVLVPAADGLRARRRDSRRPRVRRRGHALYPVHARAVRRPHAQAGQRGDRAGRLVRLGSCVALAAETLNTLGPLRGREFRLLFSGQLISLAGSAMAPSALAFAVLGIGTASDLGLVLAAAWVPQIVFILAGGVWADRLPRNLVMTVANLLSGAAQAGVAVLLLLHVAQLWHLIVLQVARGIAISFFFPASQGVVPHTVEPDHLQQANALLRLSQNGTSILGAAVGGALVATIGSGWAIAFDAAAYFASAGI